MRLWIWFVSAVVAAAACVAAPTGSTSIVSAARSQDKATLRTLVGQHVDVNAAEPDGTTALHWAAHWNDAESIDLLLHAGANVRAANRYGATPLSEAAASGSAAVVEKLLKAGADPDTVASTQGETVLMAAARVGNVAAVKALLEHGAYADARENFRGQTALMWAAAEGHADVIKLLIEHGADPTVRSSDRDTTPPKLEAGTPAAPISRGGLAALHFAARQGQIDAAKALLDGKADINEKDSDGYTALVLAILNYHYDFAQVLIDRGADLNVANKDGRAALYTAIESKDADWSPRPARRDADTLTGMDIIRALLAKGANVNQQLLGATPIVKQAQDTGDRTLAAGATPFMRAARSADVPVMKMLLEKGARPDLKNKDGLTALAVAAGVSWSDKIAGTEEQALEAVKLCVEQGLDVNAATDKGDTPLHGAALRGADSIVKYLVEKGAKLDAKNKQEFTPLDIAMGKVPAAGTPRSPHESTIALLKQLQAAATVEAVAK